MRSFKNWGRKTEERGLNAGPLPPEQRTPFIAFSDNSPRPPYISARPFRPPADLLRYAISGGVPELYSKKEYKEPKRVRA